jgi:hypothetical protein
MDKFYPEVANTTASAKFTLNVLFKDYDARWPIRKTPLIEHLRFFQRRIGRVYRRSTDDLSAMLSPVI